MAENKQPVTMSLQDARKNLSTVILNAQYKGEATIVTRSGKNSVVIIPYDHYEFYKQLHQRAIKAETDVSQYAAQP